MKLKKMIKEIPGIQYKGSRDIEVTGVCSDSKRVVPGNLFVAKKGIKNHGSVFIPDAVIGGAVAVLTDLFDPSLSGIVQLIHPNPHEIEGIIAARFYGEPSKELFTVGITGTNGKTTTSYILRHLLETKKRTVGLIGTIEYIIGKSSYQPTHTTPDVTTNHKLLKEMVFKGCDSAVMEVTSHALSQGRVREIDFDVALFTNLSLEHLDYHKTMENYCDAKKILFSGLKKEGVAIINGDDPWSSRIISACKGSIVTYGIESESDIRASGLQLTTTGTAFILEVAGDSIECEVPLVGRFNIYNTLASIAVALHQGISVHELVSALKKFPSVAGRLEMVPNDLDLKIYVDFAHTDDALENVLCSLSEFKKGKIITLFGGGGDRDRSKRPKMAAAAEKYSDFVIVTSDNPRSEDPLKICEEIAGGLKGDYLIEPDRYLAIRKAVEMANKEDMILLAGKGHERVQIFAHHTKEFDDVKVAQEICRYLKEQLECV